MTELPVQGFLLDAIAVIDGLRRRRTSHIEGREVFVMAPEDVILLKLIAYRRKDQLDVEEILKVTTDLDHAYLGDWASRLDVSRRLAEFLPEAGERHPAP